jgi:hypothetical protein
MNTLEKTEFATVMRISSEYSDEVIKFEPNSLFQKLDKPRPSRMPNMVSRAIHKEIGYRFPDIAKLGYHEVDFQGVVEQGLSNAQTFYHDAFTRKDILSPEIAAQLIRSPISIHTLGGMAMQSGGDFDNPEFQSKSPREFNVNDDMTAIEPGPIFRIEGTRGCPFAGKNGEVHIGATFTKFSIWAGTLAVQTYFNNFHNIDPTDSLRDSI